MRLINQLNWHYSSELLELCVRAQSHFNRSQKQRKHQKKKKQKKQFASKKFPNWSIMSLSLLFFSVEHCQDCSLQHKGFQHKYASQTSSPWGHLNIHIKTHWWAFFSIINGPNWICIKKQNYLPPRFFLHNTCKTFCACFPPLCRVLLSCGQLPLPLLLLLSPCFWNPGRECSAV